MKKHKGIKIALIAAAALLAVLLAGAWAMFGAQLTAANTVEKLDEGLWRMEYKGDYGFDAFLARGGAASDAEMGGYIASFLSHGSWTPDASAAGGKYGGASEEEAQKIEDIWQDIMGEYLSYSPDSRHIRAGHSTHYIHLTDAELIYEVLAS